ncbi:hypothetical protein HKBW3S42_02462, partial [Candidatus Hakubella thermalkaliphila]
LYCLDFSQSNVCELMMSMLIFIFKDSFLYSFSIDVSTVETSQVPDQKTTISFFQYSMFSGNGNIIQENITISVSSYRYFASNILLDDLLPFKVVENVIQNRQSIVTPKILVLALLDDVYEVVPSLWARGCQAPPSFFCVACFDTGNESIIFKKRIEILYLSVLMAGPRNSPLIC